MCIRDSRKGGIVVDENGLTSREGIYAGGDAVTGASHKMRGDLQCNTIFFQPKGWNPR